MALRLILVGVVASLALDLPPGGSRPIARPVHKRLVAESQPALRDADHSSSATHDLFIPRDAVTLVPDKFVASVADKVVVETQMPTEPALPILTGSIEGAATIAAEKPEVAVAPTEPALPILPGRAEADAVIAFEAARLTAETNRITGQVATIASEKAAAVLAETIGIAARSNAIASEIVTISTEKAVAVVFEPALEPAPIPVMPPAPEIGVLPLIASPTLDFIPAQVPTVEPVVPMAPPAPIEVVVAPEEAPAPAPVVADAIDPAQEESRDAAFGRVMNKMASAFVADLMAPSIPTEPKALVAQADKPTTAPAPAAAAEELSGEVDLYPGIAFVLNRQAEGLSPIAMPGQPAVDTATATEPAPAQVSETATSSESSRAEKLANAVKLTGEAMNAWAGLLSQRPSVSAMQR